MKTCPACNTENENVAKFCKECGSPLETAAIIESTEMADLPNAKLEETSESSAEVLSEAATPELASHQTSELVTPIAATVVAAEVVNPPQSATPLTPPPAPPTYIIQPRKDRSIALILEILPGLFGLLGFGWIYAGNVNSGIIWLICFLLYTIFASIIAVFTLGISLCLSLPLSIALIVISAVNLNNYTKQHSDLFTP
jgi:hypothetical protein